VRCPCGYLVLPERERAALKSLVKEAEEARYRGVI
jgi:hypothetical protein